MTTTGQDVNGAFPGGPVTLSDGETIYAGVTINVSAAQAGGDYFLHFSPSAGNTFIFPSRLYVKSSGSGYELGWVETSGATVSYGSTVLNLNQNYRLVMAYHDIAGTLNDTGALYVEPIGTPFDNMNNESGNTPYVTKSWTVTTAENETMGTINLRQGTSSIAPTLTVDDMDVSVSADDSGFADVSQWTPIPEPASLSLLGGFALLAWYNCRRRR